MNPYDDEPTYRGRSGRHGREDDYGERYPGERDPYDRYSEPTTRGASGHASVGRASVGRASVRPISPAEPVYGAPYGDAAYGNPYASEPTSPPRGTPVSPSGGTPISPARGVGRAQVRPISPSTPPPAAGGAGPGGRGPGRPPVPGAPGGEGPGGPGGHGPGGPEGSDVPAWRRPFRGFGLGVGKRGRGAGDGDLTPEAAHKKRMRRIRNISITGVAVLVMLSGAGFVGGTLFIDSVTLGTELELPETSTIYYSDGVVLARLGENTRYVVEYDDISPFVVESLIASEDRTFWTNEGVEFSAVIRAAWNNITGGSTQGGSTITQQYARVAFDLKGATYNRKVREAVFAWKLTDKYTKKEIITSYLNSVPFGRHAYGAEAAARAFFGASMMKTPPPEYHPITRTEAMALVAMVKQPYPDADDPEKYPGYDPTRGEPDSPMREKAVALALERWEYVRDGLLELHQTDPANFTLTPEEAAGLTFPVSWLPESELAGEGLDKPAGLVVNHVLDELSHSVGNETFSGKTWQWIRDGGFDIYTTLDSRAQAAAQAAADPTVQGSIMAGKPEFMQAALVAIEPGTGRVLAYYGNHIGTEEDFAGTYYTESGNAAGFGRHPPGSSFKIYTLAAALREGISLNSYWMWTPHVQGYRTFDNPIRNSNDCDTDVLHDVNGAPVRGTVQDENKVWSDPEGLHKAGSRTRYLANTGVCSLLEATTRSLNIPFIDVTLAVSPADVLQTAYDAGVKHIWNNDGNRIDLRTLGSISEANSAQGIGIEVGIGQYPITVLEHANAVATFAANGLPAGEHFVREVKDDGNVVYGETLPNPDGPRILNQGQINDLTFALHQVYGSNTLDGFQGATKTGTWEYGGMGSVDNAHAWNVGFTTKLAAAVWIGSNADEQPLRVGNQPVYGNGLPKQIWTKFITDATRAMALPKDRTQFNQPSYIGDDNPPGSYPSPTPSETPTQEPTETPSPTPTTPSTPPSSTPPTSTSASPPP